MKVKVSEIGDPLVIIRRADHAEYLKELTESIRQLGLLNPLTVRKTKVGYQLIAGYYRREAVKALGWEEVEVNEVDTDDRGALLMTVTENMQRRAQDALSEARIIATLRAQYELTQTQIGELLGKSQPWVSSRLKLLSMRPSVQEAIQLQAVPAEVVLELARIDDDAWVEAMVAAAIIGQWTLMQARAATQSYDMAKNGNTPEEAAKAAAEVTMKSGGCWFCGTVLALKDGRQPFVCQSCLDEARQVFAKAGHKVKMDR